MSSSGTNFPVVLQDVVGLQHAADQAHQSFRKVLAFRQLESVRSRICVLMHTWLGAGSLTGCRHSGKLT